MVSLVHFLEATRLLVSHSAPALAVYASPYVILSHTCWARGTDMALGTSG